MSTIFKKIITTVQRKEFLLLITCLLVYNINLREISSLDTLSSRYLPVSIIREFDLDLDEFPHLYGGVKNPGDNADQQHNEPYYLKKINNHYYSNYPVIIPLMAVPVYYLPLKLGMPVNDLTIDILSKLTASLFAVISVIMLFLTLRMITGEKTAFLVSLSYAFATSVWSISSQGLWKHGPAGMFLTIALYCLIRSSKDVKFIIYSALPLGLAVWCRQGSAIIAGVMSFWVLLRHRKQFPWYIAVLSLFCLMLVAYNLSLYGHITGGNYFLNNEHLLQYYGLGVKDIWSSSIFGGVCGLLFSPSRGILIYSPILVFAFAGMYRAWRNKPYPVFRYICISIIIYILFLSRFYAWWGGHCFGPRFFAEVLPLICVFMVFTTEDVFKRKSLKAAFVVLLVLSVFVQILGVFYYPTGHNHYLEGRDGINKKRLWSWKNSQLAWCLRKGFLQDKQFILQTEKSAKKRRMNGKYYLLKDNRIDFSTAGSEIYCEYGWNKPESWGTWATGPESMLLLKFDGIKKRKLVMRAKSFPKNGRNQEINIHLNGNPVKSHVFGNRTTGWEDIEVEAPEEYFNGGIEELKITSSHLMRASLNDTRIISFSIQYLEFN